MKKIANAIGWAILGAGMFAFGFYMMICVAMYA